MLSWIKCGGSQWCSLIDLNLDHPHFKNLEGIYIIWHGEPNPAVVYVGQGNIQDRLKKHRKDPQILTYKKNGLFATWAELNLINRDGVEKYLSDKWNPKIGRNFPGVQSIQVNSPW